MKTFDIFLDNNNVICICQEADVASFDKETKTVTFRNISGEFKGIVNMDKIIAILANDDEEDCE